MGVRPQTVFGFQSGGGLWGFLSPSLTIDCGVFLPASPSCSLAVKLPHWGCCPSPWQVPAGLPEPRAKVAVLPRGDRRDLRRLWGSTAGDREPTTACRRLRTREKVGDGQHRAKVVPHPHRRPRCLAKAQVLELAQLALRWLLWPLQQMKHAVRLKSDCAGPAWGTPRAPQGRPPSLLPGVPDFSLWLISARTHTGRPQSCLESLQQGCLCCSLPSAGEKRNTVNLSHRFRPGCAEPLVQLGSSIFCRP